jgi:hypothetical protein
MISPVAGPVIHRLLTPLSSSLNDDAARSLLSIRADAATARRVARLASKSNQGTLTADERIEYESYVMAGELIAYLQAGARARLLREVGE